MDHMNFEIRQETRFCKVNGKLGYWHCWEHYSQPLEASMLIGGAPDGIFSKVFGIVEFVDGVKRCDPTSIRFCDDDHALLCEMEKRKNEKEVN